MKIRNRVIGITCTVIAVVIAMCFLNRILLIKRSDGITDVFEFYAQKQDTVDVLVVGSSHAGMNLDSAEFWNQRGISVFVMWGSIQPFWNSYYFIREALKTQTPNVIVLEVDAATYDFEYSDSSRQVTNTAGLKFSLNKIESVMASTTPNNWIGLLFGYPYYHDRYAELSTNDFQYFPWSEGLENNKGTGVRTGTFAYGPEDCSDITEVRDIYPKEEEYLRKIIEYCCEKDIPLVLVATPVVYRREGQPYYNRVQQIADEYNVTFYNFNIMDELTGFNGFCYWEDANHLNSDGARIITRWLSDELAEKYKLTDHRGDERYSSWQINADNLNAIYERSKAQ